MCVCVCVCAAHDGDGRHAERLSVRRAPPLGGQPGESSSFFAVNYLGMHDNSFLKPIPITNNFQLLRADTNNR